MATDPFQVASEASSGYDGRVSELARPFVQFLPVTGASVSTLGPLLGAETISASDAIAERVDEVQFDLGEGPCWDALASRSPVLEPDFAARAATTWPAFCYAIESEKIGAIFAFPLIFGPLEIGAVDLYSVEPVALTADQERQTLALSSIVSRVLLRHALKLSDSAADTSMFSRRLIHQATGMVLVQLGISAEDAHLIIQARAFAESRSMQEIAEDVVDQRIRFTSDIDRTEDTP